MCEDKDGNIWILNIGETGMDMYDPNMDAFHRFAHVVDDTNSLSSNIVRYVMQDERDDI
jgi:hypothetical protein